MLLPGRCYMPCLECGRCYCQEVDGYPLLFFWQRLLPMECGRCIYHYSDIATIWLADVYCQVADGIATCYLFVFNAIWADVIALWQMEWPQFVYLWWQMLLPSGRWNGHCRVWVFPSWSDVVPRGQMDMGNYFSFSFEVVCRTSSHIWGRWYLPMFWFRDGLFTLMYNASLIHLQRFWSSLPTMLKFSKVTLWPVVL